MNSGRNKNTGYLVALILFVGLTAISNSMRDLAEIHQFTLDTSRLIAQHFLAVEARQTQLIVAKLESCESKEAPDVEAPWLEDVDEIGEPGASVGIQTAQVEVAKAERRVRRKPIEVQVAKLNKLRQFDFESAPFEFRVTTDGNDDSDITTPAQLPLTMFKSKNRKPNVIRFNTRDREMILKTLNRSINLRTAS